MLAINKFAIPGRLFLRKEGRDFRQKECPKISYLEFSKISFFCVCIKGQLSLHKYLHKEPAIRNTSTYLFQTKYHHQAKPHKYPLPSTLYSKAFT